MICESVGVGVEDQRGASQHLPGRESALKRILEKHHAEPLSLEWPQRQPGQTPDLGEAQGLLQIPGASSQKRLGKRRTEGIRLPIGPFN